MDYAPTGGDADVQLDGVSKRFGSHLAVDHVNLSVPPGSTCGIIGPNGSGKTTTLRMIMRIFHPDEGTVRVLGEPVSGKPDDRVAYLPEERSLYKSMKVRDVLRFMSKLKGYNPPDLEIDERLGKLGLGGWADKKVEQLSKGMSQKVQFLATVLPKPKLVLLDEVFSGLDPVNQVVMREAVLDLRRQGTTILFSTHDMSQAERMCDHIWMIYKGKNVLNGSLDAVQAEHGEDVIRIELPGLSKETAATLPGVTGAADVGNRLELRTAPDADRGEILRQLITHGDVRHFEVTRPTLHDIFVRIAAPDEADLQEPDAEAA